MQVKSLLKAKRFCAQLLFNHKILSHEKIVSRGIIDSYFAKLKNNLDIDVAIVGGGPSGLVAAYYLAKAGKKVALFRPETGSRRRNVGRSYDV